MTAGLYVIALPIGNPDDITIRAIEMLRNSDAIICEELRIGSRLLKSWGIDKPIYQLNEHSTIEEIEQLFRDLLLLKNKAVALISDMGTPCFADPGAELVQLCHNFGVKVYPIPGASSLMAALMVSGLKNKRFLYYGFLSAKKEERLKELRTLTQYQHLDIIFLETPYRLSTMISDVIKVLGKRRRIRLFQKLTYPDEVIFIGTLEELNNQFHKFSKAEFVLVLEAVYKR